MKSGLRLMAAILVLMGGIAPALAAPDTAPADPPKAVFETLHYEFDKVVDGTEVTHDFTVKNTGRGILEISQVKTG